VCAAEFLVGELARPELPDEWKYALVFAAEDLCFPDPALQKVVRDRLLLIAESAGVSGKAGSDRVVWSALRRAASLCEPAEANLLVPFLEQRGPVDTRAVVLLCVCRMFGSAPPSGTDLSVLQNRIAEYAQKFLDPDVFSGGENASIALNAVCALAATGDARLRQNLARAMKVRRRWLNRQLRLRFSELLDAWKAANPTATSDPSYQLLESELASLPAE
jgi:hypothetical protein